MRLISSQQITRQQTLSGGLIILSAMIQILMCAIGARAQQSQQVTNPVVRPTAPAPPVLRPPETDVLRIDSNLIVVPVSVTDTIGQAVQGLKAEDFRLEEEGRTQQIAQLGDPEQVPLEMAILLDVSGSVRERFDFEKEAATRFIKSTLKASDRAVLYAIDSTARLVQTRAALDQVANKLQTVNATESPTAFYDTVVAAADYLSKFTPAQHRRVILVISDGEDTFSETVRSATATAKAVLQADAIFYSINPSGESVRSNALSARGQNEMQTLASATGGAAFVPAGAANLDTIFKQIATELRSQYLLEYYGKTEAPKGSFRRIKVTVPTQANLRIRSRQGYYVPSK